MSANTETTLGPPKGYVECPKKCGRWTNVAGECWTCRGKAEWNAYSSCPDWTPPIAAPAAHVERRNVEVGQRRKSYDRTYTVFAIEHRCAFVCQDGDVDSIDGYVHNGGCCWESVSVLEDCELLADATPEPAKHNDAIDAIRYALSVPPELAKGEAATIVDCAVKPGWSHFSGVVCECKGTPDKSPPAQEAPKAAPVAVCIDCDTAPIDRPVPMRFFGRVGHARPICDECYQEREKYIGEGAGTPYAGPERLPKPRLAADWVEDCLPEAGR